MGAVSELVVGSSDASRSNSVPKCSGNGETDDGQVTVQGPVVVLRVDEQLRDGVLGAPGGSPGRAEEYTPGGSGVSAVWFRRLVI